MLLDTTTHRMYSDKLVFHVVELKKLADVVEEDKESLYYWASLLAATSQEEYNILAKRDEYLQEAVNEAEKINLDQELRHQYFLRKLAIMDEKAYYEDGFEKGEEKGLEKGTNKMAKLIKCLAKDDEIDKIIESAGNSDLREALFQKYNIE